MYDILPSQLICSYPQRTKPKGLIDLGYGSVYMVHESLFNRPNCFQIVVRAMSDVEVFYLNAETPQLAQVRNKAFKLTPVIFLLD